MRPTDSDREFSDPTDAGVGATKDRVFGRGQRRRATEETDPGPDGGDGDRDGAGSENDPGGPSGPTDAPTPFEPGSALERP